MYFKDYPEFTPNITPQKMFELGIMGGTYFRKIKSLKTKKIYKNNHKKFSFLKKISDDKLIQQEYDKNINYYNVEVGTTYEFWMSKNWIKEEYDPYGWIEWYCNFYNGRRTNDDIRQINRWKKSSGPKGRFRNQLQRKVNEIGKNKNTIYPRLRQTLLHWAYDSRKMKVK
tara:strand:+ start:6980 stop:7489 length:510 start_codon:yes stop_codon:yes gene_type:complete